MCADRGAATSAKLRYPNGIAVDTEGSAYVADTYDYRIQKVFARTPSPTLSSTFPFEGTFIIVDSIVYPLNYTTLGKEAGAIFVLRLGLLKLTQTEQLDR